MMTNKIRAITYCAILTLILASTICFSHVKAVPQIPHRFWGSVTVAGQPALNGTLIEAKINNITYASTTTLNGNYDFQVPADDPDTPEIEGGKTGDLILFYVAGTYAANGTFTIGGTNELDLLITTLTAYADFTADVTNGTEPLTVTFIDQSKYFDTITSWTWGFGDANITTTAVANITHTYIQNGTYTVTLTVNGTQAGQNITATETKANYITVYDSKPKADFYATPTSGLRPLTVSFYNNSTSYDGITSWLWGFGDESNSTEQNPTHTYTTAGRYNVTLTITEQDGDTSTIIKENYITVQPTAPIVEIISPTTANPIYTQPEKMIHLTLRYTEQEPLNGTLKIYNSTYTVLLVTNQTAITPGTNMPLEIDLEITATAPDGKYDLSITMFNTYNLSTTATQTNAVVIDNTPPIVAITYPSQGAYISTSQVWINGTVTEANMGSQQPTINDSRFTRAQWVSTTGAFAFKATLPDGIMSANVSFTDLAGNTGSNTTTFMVDTTLPIIGTPTQVPGVNNVQPNQAVEVSVNVTDTGSGVKNATLSYTNGTATTWYDVPMTLNATTGLWKATILGNPLGTQVKYMITAYDKAGNKAVNDNRTSYFAYPVIPEFPALTILIMAMLFTAILIALTKRRKTIKT